MLELVTRAITSAWKGFAISSALPFSVIAGLLVVFPRSHSGEIELRPITDLDAAEYAELNSLAYPNFPLSDVGGQEASTVPYFRIEPRGLVELLAQDLMRRETILAQLQRAALSNSQQGTAASPLDPQLLKQSFEFKVTPPYSPQELKDQRRRDNRQNWTVRYEGSLNPEIVRKVLGNALLDSTANVRALLQDRYNERIKITQRKVAYAIQDTEFSINNAIEDYRLRIANRLAYLQEQAKIARVLKIEKNTIEAQTFGQAGLSVLATVKAEGVPYYYRGYEAIEKELYLIQRRTNIEAFVTKLIDLGAKRRELLQTTFPTRARQAYESSPIAEGNFIAARFDVEELELVPRIPTFALYAVALLLSLAVGVLYALIRPIVSSLDARDAQKVN